MPQKLMNHYMYLLFLHIRVIMKPSVELGDPVALLFYKNIILRCILIIHKIKKPQGREMFNCSTLG